MHFSTLRGELIYKQPGEERGGKEEHEMGRGSRGEKERGAEKGEGEGRGGREEDENPERGPYVMEAEVATLSSKSLELESTKHPRYTRF